MYLTILNYRCSINELTLNHNILNVYVVPYGCKACYTQNKDEYSEYDESLEGRRRNDLSRTVAPTTEKGQLNLSKHSQPLSNIFHALPVT